MLIQLFNFECVSVCFRKLRNGFYLKTESDMVLVVSQHCVDCRLQVFGGSVTHYVEELGGMRARGGRDLFQITNIAYCCSTRKKSVTENVSYTAVSPTEIRTVFMEYNQTSYCSANLSWSRFPCGKPLVWLSFWILYKMVYPLWLRVMEYSRGRVEYSQFMLAWFTILEVVSPHLLREKENILIFHKSLELLDIRFCLFIMILYHK